MKHPAPGRALAVVVAASLLAGAHAARAQPHHGGTTTPPPSPDEVRAQEARMAFEQGVALLGEARFADAQNAFLLSFQLHPSEAALLNVGVSQRGLGRRVEALATFQRLLHDFGAELEPERVQQVQQFVRELDGEIAHLSIAVHPAEARVALDGEPLASLDDVQIDPGTHQLEATMRGYTLAHRELSLQLGEHETVALTLAPANVEGVLEVDAPSDASVRVDGDERGHGAIELDVTVGAHHIEVVRGGRAILTRDVTIAPHAPTRLSVDAGGSVLTRWWFWTGAAVLVGAAVGSYFLFLRPTEAAVPGTLGTASAITLGN